MTFLPIVERELRVAARKRNTYWGRAGVGLGAIVLAVLLHFQASNLPSALMGQRIFGGLIWVALLYCAFAGRGSTADCLSSEKREGTLGLLFLTDLKGYDVVLGKLAATSLNGFYGLLAVVPVLAVPLLLGGVSSGEFWRVVLVLVMTILLSLAGGMFVSALARDARKALGANLLLMICVMGIPPAIAAVVTYFRPPARLLTPLLYSCPIYTIHTADAGAYPMEKWNYWASTGTLLALALGFLFLASVIIPHAWQERAAGPGTRGWRSWWHRWVYGSAETRAAYRKRLLERGAYYWLSVRARLKPVQVWILMGAVGAWWLWTQIKYGSSWRTDVLNPLNITAAVMLNTALKIWICIEAGRQLGEDRRSGAFELLLSTPLGPREILRGQRRAVVRQFFWPLLVALGVEVIFMFDGLRQLPQVWPVPTEPRLPGVIWLAGMTMLVADAVALTEVAMWMGLRARTANHGILGALVRILVIPWLVVWVVSTATVMTYSGPTTRPYPGPGYFVGWWFWSGVAVDVGFGLIARHQLGTRFREIALQAYATGRSSARK